MLTLKNVKYINRFSMKNADEKEILKVKKYFTHFVNCSDFFLN